MCRTDGYFPIPMEPGVECDKMAEFLGSAVAGPLTQVWELVLVVVSPQGFVWFQKWFFFHLACRCPVLVLRLLPR
jgi:hypothetical protein